MKKNAEYNWSLKHSKFYVIIFFLNKNRTWLLQYDLGFRRIPASADSSAAGSQMKHLKLHSANDTFLLERTDNERSL